MADPTGSPLSLSLGFQVDSLQAIGTTDLLVVGLSRFQGPVWDGGLGVLQFTQDGGLSLTAIMPVHSGVPAVAVLPGTDEFTGRRVVASGTDDGSVDLWYLSGGASGPSTQLQHTQAAPARHDAAVTSLATASGSAAGHLASASADGTLRLWDCGQLLTCVGQLGGNGGAAALHAAAWAPDDPALLATAGGDGRLALWDTRRVGSTAPAAAAALGAPCLSVTALPGGRMLLAGDQLGRVSCFDTRHLAQPLQQARLHGDAVHALGVTTATAAAPVAAGGASSVSAASGSDDGGVRLLDCADLASSRQVVPAKREGETPCYIRALAWSGGDGAAQQQLFQGGWDQIVQAVPM